VRILDRPAHIADSVALRLLQIESSIDEERMWVMQRCVSCVCCHELCCFHICYVGYDPDKQGVLMEMPTSLSFIFVLLNCQSAVGAAVVT
jgi:hypothetical protein